MKNGRRKLKTSCIAYLFLSPALIIAVAFVFYPSLFVLKLSFMDWDLIKPVQEFVGWGNFSRLFAPGTEFWSAFWHTIQYGVIYIPLTIVLGLSIALALMRIEFLQGFFQTVYFFPAITSISVIAIVWSYIYNPQMGLLNSFLRVVGVPVTALPQWLNDPDLAMIALALMGVWQSLGFVVLLFVAGLRNIPTTFYDAAMVDGANQRTIFWKITLPLLSPVLFFVVFMLLINSFNVFGVVAIMTKGRPLGSTNVLLYFIYEQAFQLFDAGLASAASVTVFIIILLFVFMQMKFGEKLVFYQ